MDIYDWLLERIAGGEITDGSSLNRYKIKACGKFGADGVIRNSDILSAARERIVDPVELKRLTEFLRIKSTRTLSGVAPVAVMTSPAPCPHGKCTCCPGGTEVNTPQSYTGHEPAALRGKNYDYDPYLQTVGRIEQLEAIGHITEKIDLIIMGGTFPARDVDYQKWFVKRCFDGMNSAGTGEDPDPLKSGSETLIEAMTKNETARHRCIGLTVETRPDHCFEEHVDAMLGLGVTRVELGVQSLSDAALSAIERGHDVEDTVRATRALRDRGLKICYHMMPGIPGQSSEDDLGTFHKLFNDPRFRPDMLKIYPVVVVKGTGLYEMYERGEYEPYPLDELVELVARFKALVPPYVRIQRIQRDIPARLIEGGVRFSNLRQIVRRHMEATDRTCRCIRCREVGHKHNKSETADGLEGRIGLKREDVEIDVIRYEASGGRELFISAMNRKKNMLYGYLRLRFIPPGSQSLRDEMKGRRTAIVRELKVVGPAQEIGVRDGTHIQHLHLGKRLLEYGEELAAEEGMEQVLVTSGVGVRKYYEKRGYSRRGPYMGKML